MLFREKRSCRTATFIAAAGTAAFYCVYFASRTNIQVRWLLMMVPLILIAAAPGWQLIAQARARVAAVTGGRADRLRRASARIDVDWRFASDPRLAAVGWVRDHVPAGASIESSPYVPKWGKHPGVGAVSQAMPPRQRTKKAVSRISLQTIPRYVAEVQVREPEDVGWYSVAALRARAPDYIALSSIYFERFLHGKLVPYYPEMREYFSTLLAEAGRIRDRV